jgi:1,2-diacylglycerol 3-alpha-glucosyltransferase
MSKNILLLSNAYFPSIGGIENSLRHLAQEARIAGDKIEIIVSDIGLNEQQSGHSSVIVDEVLVTRYPLQPIKVKFLAIFNTLWSNFLLFKSLSEKHKCSPNTIVIARFHFAALIACLAGFKQVRYLVPSVFSQQVVHENVESLTWSLRLRNKLKTLLHSKVQRMALVRSDVFVFSDTMKLQCTLLVGDNSVEYSIVKPGVDSVRFSPAEEQERKNLKLQLDLPTDKPLVLFVGRFVKAKGVELLINAISKVGQPCHLILIGAGEELNSYEHKIASLGLNADVTIIRPLKEVENYYRCADIFVMSSSYEPLGQTILEAFASGLPIVAFKKSLTVNTATQELGMDEFITYANSHTDDCLAKAIEEQLRRNLTLNRQLISDKACSSFSWKKLYNDLLV